MFASRSLPLEDHPADSPLCHGIDDGDNPRRTGDLSASGPASGEQCRTGASSASGPSVALCGDVRRTGASAVSGPALTEHDERAYVQGQGYAAEEVLAVIGEEREEGGMGAAHGRVARNEQGFL